MSAQTKDLGAQPVAVPCQEDRISAETPTRRLPAPFYSDDAGIVLYHGDCLSVLPLLQPVDHCLSDPPYARDVYLRLSQPNTKEGSGKQGRLKVPLSRANSHHAQTGHQPARLARLAAGDIGAVDDLIVPVSLLLGALVTRWALVFSDVESTYRWKDALESAGLRYVRTGAWVKPDAMPQMTGDRPGTGFEPATICHAQGPMRWNGGGSLAVWTHFTSKGEARPDHPCPKPLALMVELVTLFTDEGETILDPFAGSGTTLVAAKLSGRKAIGIERDEKYCAVAAKRLREAQPGRLFDALPRAKPQSLLPKDEPVSVDARLTPSARGTAIGSAEEGPVRDARVDRLGFSERFGTAGKD